MLKKIIKESGMTHVELANQLGINSITISLWCRDKAVPIYKNLFKLCQILDKTAEELGYKVEEITVKSKKIVKKL